MDWKWLDRAYQFDGEPSGGGDAGAAAEGEGAPAAEEAPAVSDSESGMVSDDLETRGDEDPVEGDDEPVVSDSPAVGVPEDFGDIFRPSEPVSPPPAAPPAAPPVYDPRPTATEGVRVEGPPRVEFPEEDDWLNDAPKAAAQQAAAIAYSNWESQGPLRDAIGDIQGRIRGEDQRTFEQIQRSVEAAIHETEGVVTSFYAEDGPLNSDAEFRNNPELQSVVSKVIRGSLERGIWIAEEHGNVAPLQRITKDPKFIPRCLALAKADVVTPDAGLVPGASPVVQQPPKTKTGDGLTADQRKALKAAKADGSTITAAEIRKATKKVAENIW
jgi:hypothetical protein